jgi:soluble lytic murein transglycosylase-like protein
MSGWLLALVLLVFGDHPDTHATYAAWFAKAEQAYAAIAAAGEAARAPEPAIQAPLENPGFGPTFAKGIAAAQQLFGEGIAVYRTALLTQRDQPETAELGPLLAEGAARAAQFFAGSLNHYHAAMCSIPPRQAEFRGAASRDLALASLVSEASSRFDLSELWIRAVMQVESNGETDATSPKGAMGLMQVMPATYAYLSDRYGLGDDPYAPHDNILAGSAYLRELYDRYGAAGFLAAYNAGPGRYEDSLCRGCSLPAETRRYVAAVRLAVGEVLFERPQSRFYEPIAITANGALKLARTGEPMPVAERLALHSVIERAVQRAAGQK